MPRLVVDRSAPSRNPPPGGEDPLSRPLLDDPARAHDRAQVRDLALLDECQHRFLPHDQNRRTFMDTPLAMPYERSLTYTPRPVSVSTSPSSLSFATARLTVPSLISYRCIRVRWLGSSFPGAISPDSIMARRMSASCCQTGRPAS